MFAIEINEANLQKITEPHKCPALDEFDYGMFLVNTKPWYAVVGYVNERGAYQDFAILPAHKLEKNYEYDPIKIQSNWDQIVRKP